MKLNPFNTRIGLALGGGAAKGIAHIGVLKAFGYHNHRVMMMQIKEKLPLIAEAHVLQTAKV